MIVPDASAVLELLLNTARAPRIAARLFAPDESLHAPHLLDIEVAQVLRRYCRSGELHSVRARAALRDFIDLRLHRYPHDLFLGRIWQLRDNLTAYEAVYVALAEVLDAPLVTCDRRLASASGHDAAIEIIA
ncbi:MAG: type II toxin-antitoxin system VapC family toxin [Acidobacteriota bacterium]